MMMRPGVRILQVLRTRGEVGDLAAVEVLAI